MGAGPRIQLSQKQAIIAAHIAGLTYPQIAKRVKLSACSVQRVVVAYKRDSAAKATEDLGKELADYKSSLKQKSITNLELALTQSKNPDYDLYKAANIALGVMKGIGEFAGDQAQVGVIVQLSPPASWSAAYKLPSQSQACIPQPVVVEPSKQLSETCSSVSTSPDVHNTHDDTDK